MKAKLTTNHDWMRVAVTDGVKNRISLTVSQYRDSCSGKGVSSDTLRTAINAFSKIMSKKTGRTAGERMNDVLEVAQKATTLEEYVKGLEALTAT